MANLSGFDANTVEPTGEFGPITPGRYSAMIVESLMKDTSAGDGKYLKLTFQILDGEFKGRNVWANINLVNPSEKAVQIARGQLSAICRAVGILTPKDSTELHNLPLEIKVSNREHEGSVYNDVKGYFPKTQPPAASASPAGAPRSSGGTPWGAKKAI